MIERLDPRLILDAPLALASDGLVLADPTPEELLEPAVFAEPNPAVASGSPVPSLANEPAADRGDALPRERKEEVVLTTMSCGATGTVRVISLGSSTEDAAGPRTATFRFEATGCGSPPPTSMTVHISLGGDAVIGTDYNSELSYGYVLIGLTGSGFNTSGTRDVTYTAVDDQIDEPTESVTVQITAADSTPSADIVILAPNPAVSTISDNDIEWAAGDAIEGTISPSAPEDLAVPINGTIGLYVEALDRDRMKDQGTWSDFYDEVTSGDTADDYHIKWTASEGRFIQNDVEVDTAYGVDVTYLAPDYAEGQNSRLVTVTATVDDINRGDDVFGFNDEPLVLQVQVPVWQVDMKVLQDGQTPNTYNGPALDVRLGGTDLGWVEFGNPAQCEKYGGNAVLEGTVGNGGPPTGHGIVNYRKGVARQRVNGVWQVIPEMTSAVWVQDFIAPNYAWADLDTRNPNQPGGADLRKIYALDAPGLRVANNNAGIAEGVDRIEYDLSFRSMAIFNNRFSSNPNPQPWRVQFVLEPQGGQWAVVGNHIP